jgi:hypothetical protein
MGTTSKLEAATSMLVFHKMNILIVTSTDIHLNHHNDKARDRIKWRNRFGGGCGPVV